jgi:hypothetical protein
MLIGTGVPQGSFPLKALPIAAAAGAADRASIPMRPFPSAGLFAFVSGTRVALPAAFEVGFVEL